MEILSNIYISGALSGLLAAAVVDIGAFRSWKSVDAAVAYDWTTAAWRWFQGAVSGALMAAGVAGLS